MEKTITVKEAAERLGLKEPTVRLLITQKKLLAIKVPPSTYRGEWRIYVSSVIEYMSKRRKVGRPRTR